MDKAGETRGVNMNYCLMLAYTMGYYGNFVDVMDMYIALGFVVAVHKSLLRS